jgi:hypothetical protein
MRVDGAADVAAACIYNFMIVKNNFIPILLRLFHFCTLMVRSGSGLAYDDKHMRGWRRFPEGRD